MVAMASAEPQLLVAQKNVDYFRQPNVGEMVSNVNVDYVDLRNGVGQVYSPADPDTSFHKCR